MGLLDDISRFADAAKAAPPKKGMSIGDAATALEQANAYRAGLAADPTAGATAAGGYGANPFANMEAMNQAVRGSGTVTSLTDTGTKLADTPVYDVGFDVTIDGEPTFKVVHRQVIAAAALANWQVGKVLSLRVDPHDHTQVMIG